MQKPSAQHRFSPHYTWKDLTYVDQRMLYGCTVPGVRTFCECLTENGLCSSGLRNIKHFRKRIFQSLAKCFEGSKKYYERTSKIANELFI